MKISSQVKHLLSNYQLSIMEFLCPSLTIEWMVIWVFLLEIAATSASQKTPATSQKAPATLERTRFSHQADIQHFLTISMVSLADCVDQCKRRKRCSSINYKDLYKLCYLLEEGNRTVNIYSAENVHFGRKDDWNMVSKGNNNNNNNNNNILYFLHK